MSKNQFCQSCGMPMKEEKLFGTEKDGTKNEKYCCYCYKDGEFVGGDLTLDEYIKFVNNYMKTSKCGVGEKFMVWVFNRKFFLKNLERWKQK